MAGQNRQKAEARPASAMPTQPMFHRVLRAQPMTVRDTLVDIRDRFRNASSDDTLGRLELVLAEIMNNVAEHSGRDLTSGDAPEIHLCIVQHDAGLACAIADDGAVVPPECLMPRALPSAEVPDLPEGGFGWFLIQDLTETLRYYREKQRNYLAFSVPNEKALAATSKFQGAAALSPR